MSFMRSLAMKKKIALLMTFAVCVIGAAAWFIIYNAERRSAVDGARDTLGRYLTVAVSSAEREGLAGLVHAEKVWQEMYPDGRMTVIASDGRVLMDNKADAGELENHYTRGEVIGAFETGDGFELRYSKTLEAWQVYSARKAVLPGGAECVVRLSYPVAALSSIVQNVTVPFLKYFIAALALIWLCTYLVLRSIMTPLHTLSEAAAQIARGEKARFPITADDEIQTLANTLNNMQDSLASTIHEAQERKEELAQIVGALPVGVILIDDDKRIRYINQEAARICRGNGGGELPARGSAVEVILPAGELYQMLDEPDGQKTISVMRGGRVEVEATTLVLPRGRMIVLQDLTDKLRLEEARRDFFIDAGHEFQTPLAIMRTGLELMKSAPQMKEPEHAEDVDTINSLLRQQERMSRLVDDMLLLVRLDADAVPELPTLGGVNLKELIADVRDEITVLPHKKNIQIEVSAPDEASVKGIYGDLRRALLNLMENAHKYIEQGGGESGHIKVSVEDAGNAWKLIVDDDGPGVHEMDKEIIFERFRRGDGHRARGKEKKNGGYGLGLSISRRIAERHGGRLELGESRLGGAAFVMTLPKE
ncbi:MAG TPA: HAMP domain-containing protein [Candidatus Caccocola faecipullorum]|nr:HAMP domain-containing protein [Candidatus Caccocola faecipullorum]